MFVTIIINFFCFGSEPRKGRKGRGAAKRRKVDAEGKKAKRRRRRISPLTAPLTLCLKNWLLMVKFQIGFFPNFYVKC